MRRQTLRLLQGCPKVLQYLDIAGCGGFWLDREAGTSEPAVREEVGLAEHGRQRMMSGSSVLAQVVPFERALLPSVTLKDRPIQVQGVALAAWTAPVPVSFARDAVGTEAGRTSRIECESISALGSPWGGGPVYIGSIRRYPEVPRGRPGRFKPE